MARRGSGDRLCAMTARTRVIAAIKLVICTLLGGWLGALAGSPLDEALTGEATIAFVGAIFGMWLGSMIGGTGWADTAGSYRSQAELGLKRLLLVALAVAVGALTVVRTGDSSTLLAGMWIGAAIAVFQLARESRYRFVFAALLGGIFLGAAVSAAGGHTAISQRLEWVAGDSIHGIIESAKSGHLQHYYLGRDREDIMLVTVAVGYVAGGILSMCVCFILGMFSLHTYTAPEKHKRKRKPPERNKRS